MRISHVIKTDQWRSDPPILSAPYFVVSQRKLDISFRMGLNTKFHLYVLFIESLSLWHNS